MVRRKIEIKAIEDKAKLHTTFTKRRKGLEKKIDELCTRCDAEAMVVAFSNSGNAFAFGHPRVDLLVSRYLASTSSAASPSNNRAESSGGGGGVRIGGGGTVGEALAKADVEAETEKRISEAIKSGGWGAAVGNLGLAELDELESEIARIKTIVAARAAAEGETNFVSGGDSPTFPGLQDRDPRS